MKILGGGQLVAYMDDTVVVGKTRGVMKRKVKDIIEERN